MTKVADSVRKQQLFQTADAPTAKFLLLGGRGTSLSLMKQTSGETYVTLRRYNPDDGNTTIIQTVRTSESKIVSVVCTGYYDMIVAAGDFNGSVLATLEQQQ